MKFKFPAFLSLLLVSNLLVVNNANALSISDVHVSIAKFLGIPDGFTASGNFNFSPGDIGKATSIPAKTEICAPAAGAIVAAGGGPEDPVADALAAAATAGCVWLVGKAVSYAVSKGCKKGVTTGMSITEQLASFPPASPSFDVRSMSCS